MKHTEDCIRWEQIHKLETYNYVMDWPNHCRHCGGWGEFMYTYDPSPSGVSLSSGFMTDSEPCPECAQEFTCPRCGVQAWDSNSEDYEVCPFCNFQFGESDGINDVPECWCVVLDDCEEVPF